MTHAADASGVLTTCQQLALATGIALFGSVYLSTAADQHAGTHAHASGHAIDLTLLLLAGTALLASLLSLPLLRRRAA